MDFQFQNNVDAWFWWLLLSIIAVLIWNLISYRNNRRSQRPFLIRSIVFVLLLGALLQPIITRNYSKSNPLSWHLYVDNSMSMGSHQSHTLSSINSGVSDLSHVLDEQGVELTQYHFAETIRQTTSALDAKGSATDIGAVVQHIIDHQSTLAGSILITDGQPTQGIDPKQMLSDLKVPLHIVGVGETSSLVDVFIKSVDVPAVAIKGEMVESKVSVTAYGDVSGRVNVTLYADDKMIGSRFISVQGGGANTDLRFRFKPATMGKQSYQVRVSSFEEEINVNNNRQNFSITILKDRYKVAVLTGAPCFNTQVVKRILRGMDRIQMDHYTQFGAKFRPGIKSFWETSYDLIILENFPKHTLSSTWQRIFAKKLVSQKSALAWVVGPDMTEKQANIMYPFFRVKSGKTLSSHEPSSWYFTDEINSMTILGENEMLFSAMDQTELPPLSKGLSLESATPSVRILSSFSDDKETSLLLLSEENALRSVVWTSPDFYKLHFKTTGTAQANLVENLWSALFSWLMRTQGDKDMYFRLDKVFFQQGELIRVTGNRLGKDTNMAQAAMTVFKEGEKVNSTQLQYNPARERWEGQLWASSPGKYRYELVFQDKSTVSTQSGEFTVLQSQIELNNVSLNQPLLSTLSENTQGEFFLWNSRLDLPEKIENKSIIEKREEEIEPTKQWWLLALFLVFLSAEWILRRNIGLP